MIDAFLYGFFFGPGVLLLLIAFIAAVFGYASRPHDTRPNMWMAIMHKNELDHIERMSGQRQPVQQFVGTALPPATQPQVIDGTVSSQWPTRAMVVASQRTGVQIGGGE